MSNIGKKISERRKQLGLTLEEVGDAVGVGRSTVRKWENGMIKNMRMDKVYALAKVLQMNYLDLIPRDNEQDTGVKHVGIRQSERRFDASVAFDTKNSIAADLGIPQFKGTSEDKELMALLKVWKVSSPERRKSIVRVIKAMYETEE